MEKIEYNKKPGIYQFSWTKKKASFLALDSPRQRGYSLKHRGRPF